jgi:hypothetical protein
MHNSSMFAMVFSLVGEQLRCRPALATRPSPSFRHSL